ncbi:MAG: redoxin domain-containing protein [Terriglobales bacterium]|jgi:peroxiredoxin
MRKPLLVILLILFAVAIYETRRHGPGSAHPGAPPRAVQSVAPDFSLLDLEGQQLALANYKGKVVLLDFWATWCVPCRAEIPHFVAFQVKYREQGLQVVGISMDDGPKPVREFYQEFKINYPVAIGNAQVADAYGGVLGLPVTVLIGRDGRIQARYVGVVEMPVLEEKINALLQVK